MNLGIVGIVDGRDNGGGAPGRSRSSRSSGSDSSKMQIAQCRMQNECRIREKECYPYLPRYLCR